MVWHFRLLCLYDPSPCSVCNTDFARHGWVSTKQEAFYRGNLLTQTKVYLYNGEGELAETALYNGEVSAANEQQRYRYEYDSLGRVICSQEIANGAFFLLMRSSSRARSAELVSPNLFLSAIFVSPWFFIISIP